MTACMNGDLSSARAAVADGASVNKGAYIPHAPFATPLAPAAIVSRDVTAFLLAQGADPNGHGVMCTSAGHGGADALQLLIDAGGDVNWDSVGQAPVVSAIGLDNVSTVRVLLAQPSLDVTVKYDHDSLNDLARRRGVGAVKRVVGKAVSVWV